MPRRVTTQRTQGIAKLFYVLAIFVGIVMPLAMLSSFIEAGVSLNQEAMDRAGDFMFSGFCLYLAAKATVFIMNA